MNPIFLHENFIRWFNSILQSNIFPLEIFFFLIATFSLAFLIIKRNRKHSIIKKYREFNDVLMARIEQELSLSHDDIFIPIAADDDDVKQNYDNVVDELANSTDKITYLLGDAGGGKTTSLLLLCKQIIVSKKKNVFPIFIPMKGFNKNTENITSFDIDNYVNSVIIDSPSTQSLIEEYGGLTKMRRKGLLFFIFDGFDEIPMVMGNAQNSTIVENITFQLHKYLDETKSKGIISSREYRSPQFSILNHSNKHRILQLRKLSDEQIEYYINKKVQNNKVKQEILTQLFTNYSLYHLAKSPINLGLIINYFSTNASLPKSISDLYENHLVNSIKTSLWKNIFGEKEVPNQAISYHLNFAKELAKAIRSSSENGHEISILASYVFFKSLKLSELDANTIAVIKNLINAKILRCSDITLDEHTKISFSHKKWGDYFAAKWYIDNNEVPQFNAILKNSGDYDLMVLYAEIASIAKSSLVANKCWDYIKACCKEFNYVKEDSPLKTKKKNIQKGLKIDYQSQENYISMIRCLRFLVVAYSHRQECLSFFHKQLSESVILYNLSLKSSNLLVKKHLTEALPLLPTSEFQQEGLKHVFEEGVFWLNKVAIRSLIGIREVTNTTKFYLTHWITSLSRLKIESYKSIDFLIRINPSLKFMKPFIFIKRLDILLYSLSLFFVFLLNPVSVLLFSIIVFVVQEIMQKSSIKFIFDKKDKNKEPTTESKGVFDIEKAVYFNAVHFTHTSKIYTFLTLIVFVNINGKCLNLSNYSILRLFNNTYSIQSIAPIMAIIPFFCISWYETIMTLYFDKMLYGEINLKKYWKYNWLILGSTIGGISMAIFNFFIYMSGAYKLLGLNDVCFKIDFWMVGFIKSPMGIFYLLMIVAALSYVYVLFWMIFRWTSAKFTALDLPKKIDRKAIESLIAKYQSFYMFNKILSKIIDENIKIEGKWTDGKIPNQGNSQPSILLAQMEEKWLGL